MKKFLTFFFCVCAAVMVLPGCNKSGKSDAAVEESPSETVELRPIVGQYCRLYVTDFRYENTPRKFFKTVFSTPDMNDIAGEVSGAADLEILEIKDDLLKVRAVEGDGEPVEGWIWVGSVYFDREVFEILCERALAGDQEVVDVIFGCRLNIDLFDWNELFASFLKRFDEEEIAEIIEDHSYLHNGEKNVLWKFLKSEYVDFPDCVENPSHMMAMYGTKSLLEYADTYMYSRKPFFDSCTDGQGHNCLMIAIDAGNYDAVIHYLDKGFSAQYRDRAGLTLADHVKFCPDERIVALFDDVIKTGDLANACIAYLNKVQLAQNFKLIDYDMRDISYTNWVEIHEESNVAFVFMRDEDGELDRESSLNVRDIPGKGLGVSGSILGKLSYGTQVTVLERSDGQDYIDGVKDYWYKIRADKLEGWCFGGFLANAVPVTGYDYRKHVENLDYSILEQIPFSVKDKAVVVEDCELVVPGGKGVAVKACDAVEIVDELSSNVYGHFYEYEEMDVNQFDIFRSCYRYYLVRTAGGDEGILSGSKLCHTRVYDEYKIARHTQDRYKIYASYKRSRGNVDAIYADLYEYDAYGRKMRRLDCVVVSGIALNRLPFAVGYDFGSQDNEYFIPDLTLCDFYEFDYSTFDYDEGETKNASYRGYIFKGGYEGSRGKYCFSLATVRDDGLAFINFSTDSYMYHYTGAYSRSAFCCFYTGAYSSYPDICLVEWIKGIYEDEYSDDEDYEYTRYMFFTMDEFLETDLYDEVIEDGITDLYDLPF